MARRDENECAYCAQEITPEARIIGPDWRVYCSQACAEMEALATNEEADREVWLPRLESFQQASRR